MTQKVSEGAILIGLEGRDLERNLNILCRSEMLLKGKVQDRANEMLQHPPVKKGWNYSVDKVQCIVAVERWTTETKCRKHASDSSKQQAFLQDLIRHFNV